jgi:hypothetical protein
MSMHMFDLQKTNLRAGDLHVNDLGKVVPTEKELIRYAGRRRWRVELCTTRHVL